MATAPLGATSLSALIASADVVVVGTQKSPVKADKAVMFYLDIERVLRGDISVGSTLNVVWNSRRLGNGPDGSQSYRGIWFLRKTPTGIWECLSTGTPGNVEFFPDLSLPVSADPLPPELAYDAATTTLPDQIILEMAAGTPRANLRQLLAVLDGVKSPAVLRAFHYIVDAKPQDQAIVALTGLLEAGDTRGLLSVEEMMQRLTADSPGADLLASTLRMRFRSVDPLAVAALGRIATSAEGRSLVPDAAAQALGAVHTVDSVPWLGALLSNSSPQMRLYGAQGLSFFVNGVGIPRPEDSRSLDYLNKRQTSPYRTPESDRHIGYKSGEEAEFVAYWKEWWNQHTELHSSVPIR